MFVKYVKGCLTYDGLKYMLNIYSSNFAINLRIFMNPGPGNHMFKIC